MPSYPPTPAPVAAATPVAPVSTLSVRSCLVCAQPARWQVGLAARACTTHVGDLLAEMYELDPRPFAPPIVTPVGGVR